MPTKQVAVVGGGIIGTAVARRFLQVRPDTDLVLLEKEDRLAAHQSGHNSGVVHAGIYYMPGSLKAKLCRRGVGLLREFCADHGLAYDRCGSSSLPSTRSSGPGCTRCTSVPLPTACRACGSCTPLS